MRRASARTHAPAHPSSQLLWSVMEPHTSAADPRIGTVLSDRYRLVRKLGDGGMGSVYEGEHLVIKRRVAVKLLHERFTENREIVARFHREAEAATAIGHPNIVEVTDMGRCPDGTAYMVLEYLDGRDFAKDIRVEGPQPLGKVVHVLAQVCDALGAAHAKGIVHRDLKPENIYLIERAGDRCFAKVLDFGISKVSGPADRSLTQTGTALGTPYYMAPEQCQGKKDVDSRADIFALGVILFQALTGHYPFDDESYPMLVLKICTEPAPPLVQYRPDLPLGVQTVLERMLAKDRAHRFASGAVFKGALEPPRGVASAPGVRSAPRRACRGPSVLEARTPVSEPLVHARRSRAPLVLALLSATVVLGALLGVALALGIASPGHRAPRARAGAPASGPPDAGATIETTALGPPQGDRRETEAPPGAATSALDVAPTSRLHVSVIGPADADLFIDGAPVGPAPFEGAAPRDRRLHTIEARAEGWSSVAREVSFDLVEQRIVLRMEREARAGARRPPEERAIVIREAPPPPPPSSPAPPRGGEPLVGSRTIFGR